MKKLFFSAVALVAFSSVSMGNTIAVEKQESLLKEEKKIVLVEDCVAARFIAYCDARATGFSVADSQSLASSVFYYCASLSVPKSLFAN